MDSFPTVEAILVPPTQSLLFPTSFKVPNPPMTTGHTHQMAPTIMQYTGCYQTPMTVLMSLPFYQDYLEDLRDLGTHVTLPLVGVGQFHAAVVADAQLTFCAEIAAPKDQTQGLEAAGALPLSNLLWPMEAFVFHFQQLVLQSPVWHKDKTIRGVVKEETLPRAFKWRLHRILFSSLFLSFSSFCNTFRIMSLSCSSRKAKSRSSPSCSIAPSV